MAQKLSSTPLVLRAAATRTTFEVGGREGVVGEAGETTVVIAPVSVTITATNAETRRSGTKGASGPKGAGSGSATGETNAIAFAAGVRLPKAGDAPLPGENLGEIVTFAIETGNETDRSASMPNAQDAARGTGRCRRDRPTRIRPLEPSRTVAAVSEVAADAVGAAGESGLTVDGDLASLTNVTVTAVALKMGAGAAVMSEMTALKTSDLWMILAHQETCVTTAILVTVTSSDPRLIVPPSLTNCQPRQRKFRRPRLRLLPQRLAPSWLAEPPRLRSICRRQPERHHRQARGHLPRNVQCLLGIRAEEEEAEAATDYRPLARPRHPAMTVVLRSRRARGLSIRSSNSSSNSSRSSNCRSKIRSNSNSSRNNNSSDLRASNG